MTIRQQSILIGALVTGILSTSYLGFINTLCCLGVIIGGIVTVQQYVQRSGRAIEAGDGAVLGAIAGALGSIFGALFDRLLRPLGLDSQSVWQGMMEDMMEGQREMAQDFSQFQEGGTLMILFSIAIGLVLYAIFGAIGGALGTALFGEEESL